MSPVLNIRERVAAVLAREVVRLVRESFPEAASLAFSAASDEASLRLYCVLDADGGTIWASSDEHSDMLWHERTVAARLADVVRSDVARLMPALCGTRLGLQLDFDAVVEPPVDGESVLNALVDAVRLGGDTVGDAVCWVAAEAVYRAHVNGTFDDMGFGDPDGLDSVDDFVHDLAEAVGDVVNAGGVSAQVGFLRNALGERAARAALLDAAAEAEAAF